MQGRETTREVVAAIKVLIASKVDVICLVRGGGSPLDLAWFDSEAICRAIADSSVPVWVGIGHEIDATVADFVAHTSHKTPTAVAEALVERIRALDDDLILSRDRLVGVFGRRVDLAQRSIVQNRNGLRQGVRKHLEIYRTRFLGKMVKLESALDAMVSGHTIRLSERVIQLQERFRTKISIEDQNVENSSVRFGASVWRHIQRGEEVNFQNLNRLLDGTRNYLSWKIERFQRWAITLKSSIDTAFSHRLSLLCTSAILLGERMRGHRDDGERNLTRRTNELLAVLDRIIDARQNTLTLKTSRFGLAHYDRFLDQTLRNLEEKSKRLSALSPEQLLTRGYSITRNEEGRIIRSADQVKEGQAIHTQLAVGSLTSVVTQKEGSEDE